MVLRKLKVARKDQQVYGCDGETKEYESVHDQK